MSTVGLGGVRLCNVQIFENIVLLQAFTGSFGVNQMLAQIMQFRVIQRLRCGIQLI